MNTQFKAARVENYRVSDRSAADIRYLVIHFTANDGDTAKNNADYFAREAPGVSAHFFVDEKEIWALLEKALKGACEQFVQTRITEGENLKTDILGKLDDMVSKVDFIEERSPQIVEEYRTKLTDKVQELLTDGTVDESRIATEVTIYADKICTDEETVRLRSHIEHMRSTLLEGGSIGRKLDFIAQEMNREANTTLSKANDIQVSNVAIDLKTEIEKIREQIQNLE